MTGLFKGLPIQDELNIARRNAWNRTYNGDSTGRHIGSFIVHKELSLVCLVSNTASTGIGATGFVLGAVVLGTPKLATFVLTAGNVRPRYSTGCLYNGEVILSSVANIFSNTFELTYDSGYVVYKVGKGVHWTAKQLRLDGVLSRIAKEVFRQLAKVALRVADGTSKAANHEPGYTPGSPLIIAWINEPAKNTRIDFSLSERPLINILGHGALSVVNIPANAVVCGVSAAAAIPLSICFVGKVVLNSVTKLDIPGPTYAGAAYIVAGKTFYNVAADVGTLAADTGVLIYKGANALRINSLMATAIEFLGWSVMAIFS